MWILMQDGSMLNTMSIDAIQFGSTAITATTRIGPILLLSVPTGTDPDLAAQSFRKAFFNALKGGNGYFDLNHILP